MTANTTISQKGTTAEWVQTDRNMCNELLSTLPDYQRTQKRQNLSKITHDVTNGDFVQNGATIVISDTGHLIDGQHRLNAFLQAGLFPEVLIVRGVESKKGYATIDGGRSRTVSDMFKSKGVTDYACASGVASALIKLIDETYSDGSMGYSNNEIYACYVENAELIDHWRTGHRSIDHLVSKNQRASVACYCEPFVGRDTLHEFFNSIEYGIGHKTCISARKLLIANSNKVRGKLSSRDIVRMLVYAIGKYHEGVTISKIVIPKKFPYMRHENNS